MNKPTVFISYSHKDEKWKDLLLPQFKQLEKAGCLEVWDDRQIKAGDDWYARIQEVLRRTRYAVCLVSANFLSSSFCMDEEIPFLLQVRRKGGLEILPILIERCVWQAHPWLRRLQMLPRDGKDVADDFRERPHTIFSEAADQVYQALQPGYIAPPPPPPAGTQPDKVDIDRLPETGILLFGRRDELELLDTAWKDSGTRVVVFKAWGGVGKSTLIRCWCDTMAEDNYRGARKVFAWSFYSQGTGERVNSADLFIHSALTWFGDPDPTRGSPWDKGERLGRLVGDQRTLLLLDGMEPLQLGSKFDRGAIKDPALRTFLLELARKNDGLCVITTRERVPDLEGETFAQVVKHVDLEQVSPQAGRALLRVAQVRGPDADLERAVAGFGCHALALNLLGAYLGNYADRSISRAAEIPDLDVTEPEGKHPRRVMVAFERRFGDGPEVEILRMLGLFDRPAEGQEISAVRAAPPIPGLTGHLQPLGEADWLRQLQKLRAARLIASESKHRPGVLDAHPLVREHFGEQLKQQHPKAWREGNSRLYEHLKRTAKDLPETIEEMAPLYAAVAHGCEAGRHQEALDDVYHRRIHRGNEFFSTKKLGAFGADLAALRGFFERPWRKPVPGLTEADKAWVLNQAGHRLKALGRLAEAAEPLQAALDADIALKDWKNAAIDAGNLSELYVTIGALDRALAYAQQGVELADRSGDGFEPFVRRTDVAHALHQAGRLSEAEASFHEAEKMQKELQPQFPVLYSVQGFQFCDLLLDQIKYTEVQTRAAKTLEWVTSKKLLLAKALDELSLGRAYLLEAQQEATGDFAQATASLNQAAQGLRQAGQLDYLPRGLLARSALFRAAGNFDRARADLDEAMSIATRGSMALHQADCHLAYARLYLAEDKKDKARESLAKAKEMIERMGYRRRDKDLQEIAQQLGEG